MNLKDIFSIDHLRTSAAWMFLILGIGCYYFGYFQISSDSVWREIVIKIGDVLIIGVILGFVTNAAQFLGIFKKDLQDIIYGKEFLRQRKDITPLWETVSKQMFKEKFPSIHTDFLNVIRGYFPKDEVSFYNDYETNMTIEWMDKDKGVIKVTDNVSFDLIAESEKEFKYPLKSWLRIGDDQYQNKIDNFTVNGKSPNIGQGKTYREDDNICHEHHIPMKGATKYTIKYTRTKIYNINEDYYIGFRAKFIVNRLRVCLDYPDDLDVIFTCRGTQEDFEGVKKSKCCIEKKYKGVILPRQGFIFAIRINK
ncbi:MAG: hypothetical protein NC117_01830 [Pseudoflavonifractor sp.]|nr:hypothetical protein [Pseudoflavonifractor sp.]